MQKTILILNGSHSEVPLIKSAKKMGLYVITSGNDPYLIGHQYSDSFIKADFSDKELIIKIVKKMKVNFICPPAHDLGMLTASYVAEKLNLPGYDSFKKSEIVHHKDKFKDFCKKINFKTPAIFSEQYNYNDIKKIYKSSKLIIKPVDLGGGKGISIVNNERSFEKAKLKAKRASPSKKIVIEQFVQGSLHSLTTYVTNKKIVFFHHDNELTFKNPFNVHSSLAPGTLSEANLNFVITQLELFSKQLNLVDGILHAQIISNKTDCFIIELTRRCSGDLYPLPVEFITKIPWSDVIIKTFIGKINKFPNKPKSSKFCARHCLTANKNGIAKSIFVDPVINKNIFDKIVFLKENEVIRDFENKKFGVYILQFSTIEEMIDKMYRINQLLFIDT